MTLSELANQRNCVDMPEGDPRLTIWPESFFSYVSGVELASSSTWLSFSITASQLAWVKMALTIQLAMADGPLGGIRK